MFHKRFSGSFAATALMSFLSVVAIGTVGGQDRKTPSQGPDRSSQGGAPPQQPTPALRRSDRNEDSSEQADDVVRIETDLTSVFFTAVDKNKRFITTLRKDDVRLLEDGQAQEISTFQHETDRPLSLGILVDVSASQQLTLEDEKDAASRFINSVIHHARDEVAIISFSGEATIEQGLTNRRANLQEALGRIEIVLPPGYIGRGVIIQSPTQSPASVHDRLLGTTAIWDAVWAVSEELFVDVKNDKRRAIILITDGVDTSSRLKTDEAIKRAITAEVAVYAVGIGDDTNFEGIKKSPLRKIAERTGGRAYFPKNTAELQRSFTEIEQELRSQYLVAYSPSNKNQDGSYRKLEIELANPDLRKQKLLLSYRQGYFSRSAPATSRRTSQ